MTKNPTLSIRQNASVDGKYRIRLRLKRSGQPELEAESAIEFALSPQEQEDLRWYLEDYVLKADIVERVHVEQIERLIKERGIELYTKIIEGSRDAQRLFDRILDELPDLRVEIRSEIAEAASIPWELMRDPQSNSPISLRAKSFVRVQSDPNLSFVPVPKAGEGRLRLLYAVCRPAGADDVPLRAVANRLLQGLGADLARFEITALRPPTFEQLRKELQDAKEAGRPYHIVHFDGHGIYADLSKTPLAGWIAQLSSIKLGGKKSGNHGYVMFENPDSDDKMLPVSGEELGKLLHDNGVPVLVLNACQSAMHEATARPKEFDTVHDEIRAIGSLAQAVVDQGIPAVLGMRYSVFVSTAAQYVGELYASLAKGREFGQAATEARKHLHRNPDRWVSLQPRPLQDWFVPVVYEAGPLRLLRTDNIPQLGQQPEMDPVHINTSLLRYVPDHGFIGRDETLLMLDRAFDAHSVVLLHAYAGQGKTCTAVEFARWYSRTRGLGPRPIVLFSSFEFHTDLGKALHQLGQGLTAILSERGIEWNAVNDLGARRSLIVKVLRDVPVLWIWDNVEPIAGFPSGADSAWTATEQAELAEFLKQLKEDNATRVKILLTSRRHEQEWLDGIPYRVQMPPMSFVDSAGFALKLGQQKGLTIAEMADWRPLLDYCAGNPLTLRVIIGQAMNMGLRSKEQIERFVQAVRDGEQRIDDVDAAQGRDKSLTASLSYGFRTAFGEEELPIIALLHLFQGAVNVDVLVFMGKHADTALPELNGKNKEALTDLLEKARGIGLLTHVGWTYYCIQPALPWFLRNFFAATYNDGGGRSSAKAALRAWIEGVSEFGNYCHDEFERGNRNAILFLDLEEANLLHARRLARRYELPSQICSAMQGLRTLCEYEGRWAEWARLVTEIVPEYCTKEDEPVPGRQEHYSLVMGYRVDLEQRWHHNLTEAGALQEKVMVWDLQQAGATLALPEDAPLTEIQSHSLRMVAVSLERFGDILRDQADGACVECYREAIRHLSRIKDSAGEGIIHYNLACAYKDIDNIRDLDRAEAEYKHSLNLCDLHDALGRSLCLKQIGMVYHKKFKEARGRNEAKEVVMQHWLFAEKYYLDGQKLCPSFAITELGPMHNQLGVLYADIGETDRARDQYERYVQISEQSGDHYNAGKARFNLAIMYARTADRKDTQSLARDALLVAQEYARAARRDFQYYEGRSGPEEADAQQLIDKIAQMLVRLSRLHAR